MREKLRTSNAGKDNAKTQMTTKLVLDDARLQVSSSKTSRSAIPPKPVQFEIERYRRYLESGSGPAVSERDVNGARKHSPRGNPRPLGRGGYPLVRHYPPTGGGPLG